MGKLEFLDALKRAMAGLPPDLQAKTLGYYDQRFVDGVAEGRTEEEIAKQFDDPRKIAMTLRASTHMDAFQLKKNPASFMRMAFAAVGLAIFNLFMVVPAMVYAALLASLYATGLAFYLGGIVITASGLSGANQIKLDGPFRHIIIDDQDVDARGDTQTKIDIGEDGIRIYSAPDDKARPDEPGGATAGEPDAAAARTAAQAAADAAEAGADAAETGADAAREAADAAREAASADPGAGDKRSVRVIKQAESVASKGIVVSTDMDDESRATQTAMGLAMVLGGILLLLLSLVITRYTFIGIKRYIEMNLSLLRGN